MIGTPWLPTDIGDVGARELLTHPDWLAQEKADGVHVMVEIVADPTTDRLTYRAITARSGRPTTSLPRECGWALAATLPLGSIVSGEAIPNGPFVVFDMLQLADVDMRPMRTDLRWQTCVQALEPALCPTLALVRTGRTTADKRALYEALQKDQAEGMIFKDAASPYLAGRPTVGGPLRRWKWRKSADVILLRRPNDTKQSFEMFVYDQPDRLVSLGSVSARTIDPRTRKPFYESLAPGQSAIAEVSYLYGGAQFHLVQPTIVRLRDDKPAEACTKDQVQLGPRWRTA